MPQVTGHKENEQLGTGEKSQEVAIVREPVCTLVYYDMLIGTTDNHLSLCQW